MDKRAEIIKELIEERGYNLRTFAEKIEIPYTTLYSILNRGIGKASVDNVLKICKGLGITTDELENLANDGDTKIQTIAAHIEDDVTDEELEEIRKYIEFIKSKRK